MQNDEQKLFTIVRDIVNKYDPINLLSFSPEDEYDPEIKEITNFIYLHNPDEKELAEEIYKVFIKWFGEDMVQHKDGYSELSKDLINKMQ